MEGVVSASKALVRAAGAMMPWPGDAAANLLVNLLSMTERALINGRNWAQLNARAVDLLQLIAANKTLQADANAYRHLMARLIHTLKVRASRLVEKIRVGASVEQCSELVSLSKQDMCLHCIYMTRRRALLLGDMPRALITARCKFHS